MWDAIKLWASKIWSILRPSVMVWLTDLGQRVLNLAMEVVTELQKTDLASEEKRNAAFNTIKEKLEEEGKEVKSSLINLAIEIAVNKLKSLA